MTTKSVIEHPTWNDDVLPLFKTPYWVSDPESTGGNWQAMMQYYGFGQDLQKPEDVQKDVRTIYEHLRSRSMPVAAADEEFWPDEALETLRNWANDGFRISSADQISLQAQQEIPKPLEPPMTMRVRKDILSLSPEELQTYRVKLDDVLGVGKVDSKWQEFGRLHAQWCLHYQEGFVMWHRAMLRWIETMIDFPLPYWNIFAADAADPNSLIAGIPWMFLEDEYMHPTRGKSRNPLKYALTLDGHNPTTNSEFIVRDPTLVEGSSAPKWKEKMAFVPQYHDQFATALAQDDYSHATEDGTPWGNLGKFKDLMDDDDYSYRETFDGLFEQVHDNIHGWVGGLAGDMSDSTYTAFDPLFTSFHCNLDRLASSYQRAHPQQQYSCNYPLQPFVDNGTRVDYSEPRLYKYTTLGDMAKNTLSHGYLYAPPAHADYHPLAKPSKDVLKPRVSSVVHLVTPSSVLPDGPNDASAPKEETPPSSNPNKRDKNPWIAFPNVTCTTDSYVTDIFVADAPSLDANHATNPDFVGRVTRFGMGPGPANEGLKNIQRCNKPSVTRALPVGDDFLGRLAEKDWKIRTVTTNLKKGEVVGDEEARRIGGCEGKVVWRLGQKKPAAS